LRHPIFARLAATFPDAFTPDLAADGFSATALPGSFGLLSGLRAYV
jgi:hypothetical protein